jgi:hypothetical protein
VPHLKRNSNLHGLMGLDARPCVSLKVVRQALHAHLSCAHQWFATNHALCLLVCASLCRQSCC